MEVQTSTIGVGKTNKNPGKTKGKFSNFSKTGGQYINWSPSWLAANDFKI
jgi:hypothetical protein